MRHSRDAAGEKLAPEPSQRDFLSFQQFVTAHETDVFTYCFHMLGNLQLAECAATRAFQDVYAHFPNISLSHVLAMACHHCRKQLRHNPHPMNTAAHDIQAIFDQLTLAEREVMTLRYACKLDFVEIAAILNTSPEAVRVILRQGRWHVADMKPSAQQISFNPYSPT